jgi:L-seryl-tRNA(Ser) seleniumtransferase
MADSVTGIPSVTTETWVPDIANHVPHLKVHWDQSKVKLTPNQVMKMLREGQPSIEASPATDKDNLVLAVWMLEKGEAEIVARRVAAVLKSA